MDKAKQVIIETFNTNNYLITKALEGLSDDDFFKQPNENTNPISFIVGHLTHYRYQVSAMLGNTENYPHAKLFAMGEKVQEQSAYPSVEELKAEWGNITSLLQSLLEKVDIETLSKPTPKKQPIGEQNIMGTLQFLFFHEAYHLGQICLVRKFHGYEGIIG